MRKVTHKLRAMQKMRGTQKCSITVLMGAIRVVAVQSRVVRVDDVCS